MNYSPWSIEKLNYTIVYVLGRRGRCLSEVYKNNYTKLIFECEEKHTWWAKPSNIIHGKSWCPTCANEAKKKKPLAQIKIVVPV